MGMGIAKMSRNGQIVIPAEIRETMGIEPADRFLVISEGEEIVLRRIRKTSRRKELLDLLELSEKYADEKGITKEDVERAIVEVRKAKRQAK
ncbi:MAG: AbrB/MazE/SpoVT family DNA-binding domain-containing protein [Methanobacteriota archaeon]